MSEADGRTCANCRFWEAGVYEVEAADETNGGEESDLAVTAMDLGLCHRYPQFVTRVSSYWCGEWQPQWQAGQAYD
jgi:hypothetical protein